MDKVTNIAKVLHDINRPFCAIIGGAKVSDKITLIENLMEKQIRLSSAEVWLLPLSRRRTVQIGDSLCETDKLDLASDILKKQWKGS
jgi:phosphoglycerate kinase